MNVEQMTFGVEIETTIPAGTILVGPHSRGAAIPQLTGWKADNDPSIRATRGHVACEFVSPVFTGSAGLQQLLADLAVIKGMGAKVNASCGLHVHVGFNKTDTVAVEKLLTLVANFEKAIFASTGSKSRETGRWCHGINRHGDAARAVQANRNNRYYVANLSSCNPTVEFRAFGATLNPVKLVGYIRLCVGLVERALRAAKVTNWTAKTPVESSPIHRGGAGETAMNRLFYQLGWTKGRQSHVHGNLAGERVPSLKGTKKELMRLAKKYDAPVPVATTGNAAFPVGTRVTVEYPGGFGFQHGQEGMVVLRRPRCVPVVQFTSGRRYRIRLQYLRVAPIVAPAAPAPLEF